jgi:diguanylate cyclase (GGDEF)-like protein
MDYPQELRVRRLLIAIAGYGVISAAILACYLAGFVRVLSLSGVLLILASVFMANGLIFFIIVKGVNKRFKDPSMTTIQLLTGIFFSTILCYYMEGELRGTGCLIYTMVFVFGTFKTQLSKLFLLSVITTAMYAASMAFLYCHDPAAVDFRLEALRSGILLVALRWISYMASYIALLRVKIKKLATHDALTGVYSRREIYEVLEREKALFDRSQAPFSLCILDLDDFKKINDTYGHQAGDQVLKSFAELVKKNIRSADYVGRYGGDEFFVIFVNFDCARSDDDCANINRLLSMARQLRFPEISESINLTVSAGVAVYRIGESIDSLVGRADKALYSAKAKGKNRIEFSR